MQNFTAFFVSISVLINLFFSSFTYLFKPVIEVDAGKIEGEISSRASGYLYGLAEEGVPSGYMAESLDISSVSQKVINGLQHPVGDVDHVSDNLKNCDYIVVYLQDSYDTWYYAYDAINKMREEGTYDWKSFVENDFLPRVEEKANSLKNKDYADKLVYCLYNECDNGVWFGDYWNGGKENFYEGWKMAYEKLKSICPDALVGGPGYYEYNLDKISDFLKFCKENDCLPDIMIYHELYNNSSIWWEDHVKEYRNVEKEIGINELPIIVTEYGTMEECGVPGKMLRYITSIEKSGTYANIAFWRLADNLCDNASDDNMPNSCWWLYRWYADMDGSRLSAETIDLLHSDFANVIKYRRDKVHYSQLDGMASINDSKDEITVLLGGCDYESTVAVKNIGKTGLGKNVTVKIEAVYFKGISGAVTAPVVIKEYNAKISGTKLNIKVPCNDKSAVYRVTISTASGESNYNISSLPQRFEFESGTLLGTSYTYDSAYGTTGEVQGMVGGIENEGDGVSLDFNVSENADYTLNIIFGNANDGSKPDDRKDAKAICVIDGKETEISFPNTIKSEYTDNYPIDIHLSSGSHNISFRHCEGTYVLDSMLVEKKANDISVIPDSDRSANGKTAFLSVVPTDGVYQISSAPETDFTIDIAKGKTDKNGNAAVYLRRGLNYIEINKNDVDCTVSKSDISLNIATVNASEMDLSGSAILVDGDVDGITSSDGCASFTVKADSDCTACLTFTYANNAEGGVHSYNVDLIEKYITVDVNGETQNVWCRSTYSNDTYKTVTVYVNLNEGENVIKLTNNGDCTFNNTDSSCPHIASVSVNKAIK